MEANSQLVASCHRRLFRGKDQGRLEGDPSKISSQGSQNLYHKHEDSTKRGKLFWYDLPDISKTRWYVCCDCSTKELCIRE